MNKRRKGVLPAILKDCPESLEEALEADMLAAIMPVAFNWGTSPECPLIVAIQMGASSDIVELLLKNDADPNQCESDGWSPLKIVAASRPLFEKDDNDNQRRLRADTWCPVQPLSQAAASSAGLPPVRLEDRLNAVASPARPRADTCPAPFFLDLLEPFDPFVGQDGQLLDPFPLTPSMSQERRPANTAGYAPAPLGAIAEEAAQPQQQQRQRCRMSDERCLQLTEVLLKYRADPLVRDADGMTAADHAAENGRDSLADLLRKAGRMMPRH